MRSCPPSYNACYARSAVEQWLGTRLRLRRRRGERAPRPCRRRSVASTTPILGATVVDGRIARRRVSIVARRGSYILQTHTYCKYETRDANEVRFRPWSRHPSSSAGRPRPIARAARPPSYLPQTSQPLARATPETQQPPWATSTKAACGAIMAAHGLSPSTR